MTVDYYAMDFTLRYTSNPFASNPWVFVYDKLTWEAKR